MKSSYRVALPVNDAKKPELRCSNAAAARCCAVGGVPWVTESACHRVAICSMLSFALAGTLWIFIIHIFIAGGFYSVVDVGITSDLFTGHGICAILVNST